MEPWKPEVGSIVLYKLTQYDATMINKRRQDFAKSNYKDLETGLQAHYGNPASEGDEVPLIVVRVWDQSGLPDDRSINGQAILDGNDTFWVTSVHGGYEPGKFHV